jgi:hypothetical protein
LSNVCRPIYQDISVYSLTQLFVPCCPRPAGPPQAESCKFAAATSLTQDTQVQAQWCLLFHVLIFPPCTRACACLSTQPPAAAAAAAAVSRRSSRGFPPFTPLQLAVPARGSVIWTTTLSGRNWHFKLKNYARGRPLAPSILRMPS